MQMMDYWAIAERAIEIQNPITDRKMRLLDDYCALRDGLRVLDVGCGKGWLLRQWAERCDIHGTGLDINPHFIRFAEAAAARKGLGARLRFVHGPALAYAPEPASFDIVLCLGASFALGGFVEALDWMAGAVRPGGSLVVGEMTLRHHPSFPIGVVLPHDAADSIALIERHGAEVSATISASEADFERYVSHHRQATLAWGREHADHPDHAEVLRQSRADWTHYLKIIRPYFGWTIFVARRDD